MIHQLKLKKILLALSCFGLLGHTGRSQSQFLPATAINLTDLSGFKPVGNNWKLAQDVFFDPVKGGKAKVTGGTGVLVNTPTDKDRANLFTNLEHGDLELELEFMMAKGSNSGVYLQGRYEVQLFDSWGKANPTFADAAGIYQRWDSSRGQGREGFEGRAPLVNVSRAPGLWQHYRILFQAPRFNAQGQKTANARFLKVYHNGVLVQDNVEVTGPTRSGAFQDEKPLGPLMIQGDHGPVAIRNIKYKTYSADKVTVSNIKYTAYDGEYHRLPDFTKLTAVKEGTLDYIQPMPGNQTTNNAGQLTGTIQIPKAGQYLFELQYAAISPDPHFGNDPSGGVTFFIAGKKVMDLDRRGKPTTATVELPAGSHPFIIQYYRRWWGRNNSLRFLVEGPGIQRQAVGAAPDMPDSNPIGAITVLAADEPVVLRTFVHYNGQKKTHAVSVGEPGEMNYSLDLKGGALLQVWRGPFMETTAMWHSRGETQLGSPLGSVIPFSGAPSLALLPDKNAPWPDSITSTANYKYWGYSLDKAGRPTFKYTFGSTEVREQFMPENQGRVLKRMLTLPGNAAGIYCRAATGKISDLGDGLYSINDKQYFIQFADNKGSIVVRTSNGQQELLVSAKDTQIAYTIIW